MSKVLLVGMNKKDQASMEKIFTSVKVDVEVLESIETSLDRLSTDPPALVVAGEPESLNTLHSLKDTLRTKSPSTPFIVTMKTHQANRALEIMRAGAYDCLSKPYSRLDVLASSKRATLLKGRALFMSKVKPPDRRPFRLVSWVLVILLLISGLASHIQGPPVNILALDSKYLTGLQWEGRNLWVGDWFNGTVSKFKLRGGLTKKSRKLKVEGLFRMKDGQPILVCHTPEILITIGTDLKMRSHKWEVGLPTVQSARTPGSNPTGMAWDGEFLWTIDAGTSLIYRYDRFFRVLESKKSMVANPIGLVWFENGLWVMGSDPFEIAKLEKVRSGTVWRGPYSLSDWLPAEKKPTGMAMGFNRIWFIFDGDATMVSKSISEILKKSNKWTPRSNEGDGE